MTFRRAMITLLSVLMVATVLTVAPRAASAQPTNDEQRVTAVDEVLAALEAYGADNGNWDFPDAAWNRVSWTWLSRDDVTPTTVSVATTLADGGYLDPLAVPEDPTIAGDPNNGFIVATCQDRVAVFSLSDGIGTDGIDGEWWDVNGCDRAPIDGFNHPYMRLSQPLPPSADDQRVIAVSQAVGRWSLMVRRICRIGLLVVARMGMVRVGISSTMMVRIRIRLCRCWLLGGTSMAGMCWWIRLIPMRGIRRMTFWCTGVRTGWGCSRSLMV